MKTTTPTLTLTGYLGRDVATELTARRDWSRTFHDPVVDGPVTVEGASEPREYAKLSMAIHQGYGRNRRTVWHQLRAWNLDQHPDEVKIRTAKKGQRVEVQGYWESHRYTGSDGQQREFRYLVVTSFRHRPGRLLSLRQEARAA